MKKTKLLLAAAILATVGMYPVVSGASPKKPAPISASLMNSTIQSEVNGQFHADKTKGESTSCTYVEKKMQIGYSFKCFTYDKGGNEIANTAITVTAPKDGQWTWNYSIQPITPTLSNSAKATYIVTGPPGARADVTIYDASGSIQKNNVKLPFSITEVAGNSASMFADNFSSSNSSFISCEIEEPPAPVIKKTSTGPEASVSCM